MKTKIYFAASLFNGRECVFNVSLTKRLASEGYETFLPQRDGFEFGKMGKALVNNLQTDEIGSAVQNVIYFYDMGVQLPDSNVVVANLDEPIDEGIVVEISYARLMGKPVIGFRTDVRSPYGSGTDDLGGMHFFPAYQCDVFIRSDVSAKNPNQAGHQLDDLVEEIDLAIKSKNRKMVKDFPAYVKSNPYFRKIFSGARLLFKDIKDIHSPVGLSKIVSRYVKNKEKLKQSSPKISKP